MTDNIKTAERWWTYPAVAENGKTVLVTGRDNLVRQRESGKYVNRIDVVWHYEAKPDGMPQDDDATLMGAATEALVNTFKKEKAAILTGIYTGDGARNWVFYCKNLKAFSFAFNRALEELDQMPLEIEAYSDPDWEEYDQMRESTYIPADEDE